MNAAARWQEKVMRLSEQTPGDDGACAWRLRCTIGRATVLDTRLGITA